MRYIVFFSGGLMSWAAAKRAQEKAPGRVTLLFTDTRAEDPDLYRFLAQAAENVGAPLVHIADGRTPWEVFRDVKLLGNSRADPCSRILKREPAEKWLAANCEPETTTLVFGIDWTETHRFDDSEGHGVKPRYAALGWPHVWAPMMEAPYLDRRDLIALARSEGLEPGRTYGEGFSHDNCARKCIKAGKGHWAHLLRVHPEIFAEAEREEDAFNAGRPGRKMQTILRDEIEGEPSRPLSLRALRERVQSGGQVDMFDLGGCGCFVGNGDE
jgi:hypothetical protein